MRDEPRPLLAGRASEPPLSQVALAAGSVVAYILAFYFLYPKVGDNAAAMTLVPVVAIAMVWGAKAGALSAVLSILLNTLLLNSVGESGWDVGLRPGALPGEIGSIVTGAIVGRMRDLRVQIQRELADRKRAEATLDSTNASLQAQHDFALQVMNAMAHGLIVTNNDRRFMFVNSAFARMVGYAPEALIGKTAEDMTEGEDRTFIREQVRRRHLGESSTYETRMKRADGTYVHILISAVPRWQDGRVVGAIAAVTDLTEQKQAAEALRKSEERYRHLVDRASDIIFETDGRGAITFINPMALRILGYTKEELLGRHFLDLVAPDARKAAEQFYKQQLVGKIASTYYEMPALTNDGTEIWLGQNVQLIAEDDRGTRLQAVARNITARKRAEQALEDANARLAISVEELERRDRENTLLMEMGELLQACQTFEEGYEIVIRFVPQLFPEMPGGLALLKPSKDFLETVVSWGNLPPEGRLFAPDDCWAVRRGHAHRVDDPRTGMLCRHVPDPMPGGYMCVPMVVAGETMGILHLRSAGPEPREPEDVQRRADARGRLAVTVGETIALALSNMRLRDTLRAQSIRDPLTGLFNRRYMEESMSRELHRAAREGVPVAAIMLDLDHFKLFNDTFGHAAGDALLRALARSLQQNIRADDIACRYGGEEFTLILPAISTDDALRRAQQIRESIKHLNVQHLGASLGSVSVSIGVSFFPEHGETVEALLRAADAALYCAKAEGRDRIVIFHAGLRNEGAFTRAGL